MSNYFSQDKFYEIDIVPLCEFKDNFIVFTSYNVIPGCDENCIIVADNAKFDEITKLCCISLDKAEYYPYDKMDGIENWILDNAEKNKLIDILKSEYWGRANCNCYQGAIDSVNDYNEWYRAGLNRSLEQDMPDYIQLPE